MPKLTKTLVERAHPEGQRVILRDNEVPGFQCRVSPTGARTFFLYYRTRNGQERRPKIGTFGDLTVDQAREIAREWRRRIAHGDDPSQDKKDARVAPTVQDLGGRYMREQAPRKKPRSAAEDQRLWKLHILPQLGTRTVADVRARDVEELHTAMRSRPGAANRTLALLSKACNLAERWGWRPTGTNPCRGVDRYPENRRRRYLTQDEAKCLGRMLLDFEAEGRSERRFAGMARLLYLTGARLREIMNARWEWIDWESARLRLPNSKTGEKEIVLPLPTVSVLQTLYDERSEGAPWVIRGSDPQRGIWRAPRKPGVGSLAPRGSRTYGCTFSVTASRA